MNKQYVMWGLSKLYHMVVTVGIGMAMQAVLVKDLIRGLQPYGLAFHFFLFIFKALLIILIL